MAQRRLTSDGLWLIAALGGLVAVALALRLVGIDHGRPYVYHPDEWVVAKPAIQMVQHNGWNPHLFLYPSALMYAEKALVAIIHATTGAPLVSPIAYGFDTLAYRGYYEAIPEQFDFYLAGRILVAILGSITVVVVYAAGRAAGGRAAGIAAALVVALVPLAVSHSHYLTTDVPSAMVVAIVLLLTIRGHEGGRTLLLAGLVAGFAASTKYNAGAVVLAPLIVALALPEPLRARIRLAAGITAASMVGFLALTPATLLEPWSIVDALRTQVVAYTSGPGVSGDNGAEFWIRYLWLEGLGPAFALATLFGIVAAATRRTRTMAGILGFTTVYFAIVAVAALRFERNLLPLIPAFAILVGIGVADLGRLVHVRRLGHAAIAVVAVGLVAIGCAQSLRIDIGRDQAFLRTDTRTVALEWINANVPPGSRIARENYTPQPAPDRYEVGCIVWLSEHPLDWYRTQEVDFVVASEYIFGYLTDGAEGQFYRELFAEPIALDLGPDASSTGPRIVIVDLRATP